ncbi:glycosyltransferase family 4 protein [Dyadobacter luticola]|uniref:Glycosyltransferase family 4 protein n=1 Tax=Dyadobacter luticola TaxID=1979387 RepID=A0A5R9KWV9_9BACT|nr:glycosyltransferase family 4 protein [Dyadobacter luticola]TLV00776.1 glycosyltransferase family 4 protein [Dyadobacter luticola]
MSNKNILLLAHDGEDFYKARMPLARYLRKEGFQVFVLLPSDNYIDLIKQEGIHVEHSNLARAVKNPLSLIKALFEVRGFASKHQIGIVHSFKFVPNLINAFSNIFTKRKVILHIAGLGIAFANTDFKYRILKLLSQILFFLQFLRANLVIIQNPDDYGDFLFKSSFREKIKLVKGSGVDITKFSPREAPINYATLSRKLIFLCTTRLIWEKGIREMVEAFSTLPEFLKQNIQLQIIGEPDYHNPRTVTPDYIEQFKNSELIRFLGRQNNIPTFLRESDVFILPSYYREGIPRSILEALACGLPVITTNVPGCNLTVKNGENGLMIEPRSVSAIKTAVETLISQKVNWNAIGDASRKLALSEFSEETVFSQIVKLYNL